MRDGQLIGSLAFKRFCERERYEGVRFRDFECDEVHVHVLIETVVPFDSERRQTRFENFCSACGNYESVVGATPSF